MSKGDFDGYVRFLQDELEGDYSNKKTDPGGKTVRGLSKSTRESHGLGDHVTREQANEVYRKHYWDAYGCGRFPPIVAWLVCDVRVNHSSKTANRILQYACDAFPDGVWGPKSKRALDEVASSKPQPEFVADYLYWRRKELVRRARQLTEHHQSSPADLDEAWQQVWGLQNRLDKLKFGLWLAGHIKRPSTKKEQNSATVTSASVGAAVGATVATAAVVESTGGGILEAVVDVATVANPEIAAFVPVAAAAFGVVGRFWAKLRGR